MDLTQPATPAEFVAAGATPEHAATLAAQHNLMSGRGGTPEERVEFRHSIADQPPPAPPAPPPPTTAAAANAALAAHESGRLDAELGHVYAAPASIEAYRFPAASADPPTDEQVAGDAAVKAAFFAEGVPAFVLNSIALNVANAIATQKNETPVQTAARQESQKGTLARWYGPELAANMRLADSLIEQMQERQPALRPYIDAAIEHLSALDIDQLVQLAKQRATARR